VNKEHTGEQRLTAKEAMAC